MVLSVVNTLIIVRQNNFICSLTASREMRNYATDFAKGDTKSKTEIPSAGDSHRM